MRKESMVLFNQDLPTPIDEIIERLESAASWSKGKLLEPFELELRAREIVGWSSGG